MNGVLAIARNTLLQTMRRLSAMVVLLFLLLAFVVLAFFLEGDNTTTGLLRVSLTWSFSLMSGLLMLLCVALSSTVLDQEMTGGQLILTDVKPVTRGQILLGKWLGLALLFAWLLILMGTLTWGGLFWMIRPESRSHSLDAVKRELDIDVAFREVLNSRRSARPTVANLDKDVAAYRERLRKQGVLTGDIKDKSKLDLVLRKILNVKLLPIDFGASRTFEFGGLPAGLEPGAELVIRHELHGRRGGAQASNLQHRWTLIDPDSGATRVVDRQSKAGKTEEFRVPAGIISASGRLRITLQNLSGPDGTKPPARIVVPVETGLEVLVPTGRFGANFARSLTLLWIRLAMLAGIGIAFNAFVRGQVVAFMLIAVLTAGSLNSFVQSFLEPKAESVEQLKQLAAEALEDKPKTVLDRIGDGLGLVLPAALTVLPDFSETNPVPDLRVAREIPTGRVLLQLVKDLLLRAGLLGLIATAAFDRRELGLPRL